MKKTNRMVKLLACLVLAVCVIFSGSVVFAAEADTIPPTAPTNLRYNVLSGYMSVSWTASTDNVGVDHYEVTVYNFVTQQTNVGKTSRTSYSIGSVQEPVPSYRVSVVAVDAAGNRSMSATMYTPGQTSPAMLSAEVDTTPPSTPQNLMYNQVSGVFSIRWDASTDNVGVDHYEVTTYNYVTGETKVSNTTGTSYTIGFVQSHMPSYRIFVVAVDAAGNRSNSAVIFTPGDTADKAAPSAITGLTYTAKNNYVYVKWNASTDNVGVDHYELTLYNYVTGKTTTATTANTEYAVTPMVSNLMSYRVTVVAVDAAGNRSESATINTPGFQEDNEAPSMPANLMVTLGPMSMRLAKWDASTDNVGVEYYEITLHNYNNNTEEVFTTTDTSYQWMENGADRVFTRIDVVAVDAAGNRSQAAILHI